MFLGQPFQEMDYLIPKPFRFTNGLGLYLPDIFVVSLQGDLPVLNVPAHTVQRCPATPPLFLHQGETAVHCSADGSGARDSDEHVVCRFLPEVVEQKDGDPVLVCNLFENGQVPVIIGVGVVTVDASDHLQGIDDNQNGITVVRQKGFQLLLQALAESVTLGTARFQ